MNSPFSTRSKDASADETPREAGIPRQAKLTIAVVLVGGIAAILDTTMVTLAIRTLTIHLHSNAATIQWVTTAYLLALGVAVPLSGWLEARLGGKRAWILALTVFGIASVLCALAWNDVSLIAFRAVQGIGGGFIMPLIQTLAVRSAGGRPTTNLMAAVSLPAALGPILGPVFGGLILNTLAWQWLFLVNVPIIALGIILAWRLLPGDAPARAKAARLDWVGLLLLCPALVGILFGLSQTALRGGLGHPEAWVPLTAGIVLLIGFIIWALQTSMPLVDVRLLRRRSLSSASTVLFTAGAVLFSGMFLLPLFFQQLHGQSVLGAGLLMIAQGVGALMIRLVTGSIVTRIGVKTTTVAAFLLTALTTVPFAFADANSSLIWLTAVLFLRGIGVGAVLIPPMSVAYQDIGQTQIAHASMHTRIMQQVGGSFGTALVAVVLQFCLNAHHGDAAWGFQAAFWWAAGTALVAVIPALTLPGKARDHQTQ
jgi:EmrB/QacA subfamily drug resistance transporter